MYRHAPLQHSVSGLILIRITTIILNPHLEELTIFEAHSKSVCSPIYFCFFLRMQVISCNKSRQMVK